MTDKQYDRILLNRMKREELSKMLEAMTSDETTSIEIGALSKRNITKLNLKAYPDIFSELKTIVWYKIRVLCPSIYAQSG